MAFGNNASPTWNPITVSYCVYFIVNVLFLWIRVVRLQLCAQREFEACIYWTLALPQRCLIAKYFLNWAGLGVCVGRYLNSTQYIMFTKTSVF